MARNLCYDCGAHIAANAVGCAQCGRNLEAERRVARALAWGTLVAAAGLLAGGLVWLLR